MRRSIAEAIARARDDSRWTTPRRPRIRPVAQPQPLEKTREQLTWERINLRCDEWWRRNRYVMDNSLLEVVAKVLKERNGNPKLIADFEKFKNSIQPPVLDGARGSAG